MSEAKPTTPPEAKPAKPKRRRRWFLRLVVFVVGLVVAIVVIAQLVLWSSLPRSIVESQIGSILNVDAKLGSLKIGWFGDVAVRDLTLRLPTEKEPFLAVDRADLQLAPLWEIAFDQELRALTVRGVDLHVREQPGGTWNLQQLVASAAAPSPEPQQPTSPARIIATLPRVDLDETKVTVTRLNGRELVLPDVSAKVERPTPRRATFEAHVGPEISVAGEAAALGTVPHEATVTLTRPPPGLAAFLGMDELPSPIHASLAWDGRLTRGGLTGTLDIRDVTASLASVRGPVRFEARDDGSLVVSPVGLQVRAEPDATTRPTTAPLTTTTPTTRPAGPILLTLDAGRIRVDDRVRIEKLRGTVAEAGAKKPGRFAADGSLDATTYAGELAVAWEDIARAGVNSTGHLDVVTRPQFTGKLRLDAGASTTVDLPGGRAVATLVVDGQGVALDDFTANLNLKPLTWHPTGGEQLAAPELAGTIVGSGDAVDLTSLRNVDATLGDVVARAHVEKSTLTWWATLDARDVKLPPLQAMGVKDPIDANVAAYGNAEVYVVQHLYGRTGPASAWATGAYRISDPQPLRLDTWAWYGRVDAGDGTAQMGGLAAQGVVGGIVAPPDLKAALDVTAKDLVAQGRTIGDVDVRVDAELTADRLQVASREMEMLGGAFTFAAHRDLTDADAPYLATLDFRNIPVARLGAVVEQQGLSGTIDEGHVDVTVPASLNVDDVEAQASVRGTNLRFMASPDAPPLQAESLIVAAAFKDGELHVAPALREGEGTLNATLVADAKLERPIRVGFELVRWPAPAAAATTQAAAEAGPNEPAATRPAAPATAALTASARGDVAVTLRDGGKGVDATLTMNAGIDRDATRLAALSVDASATNAVVTLKQLTLGTLGGRLGASGVIDLNRINATRIDATFDDLLPSTLAWYDPIIAEVRGRYDGSLTIAPASSPRPLGPLEMTLAVRPSRDAGFRSVSLGAIDARLFADYESAAKYRVVTDRATIHVADGTVNPFGRFSYDADRGPSQLVTVRFDRLDVDQLTRAVKDDGQPVVGRLGGTVRVYGPAMTLATVNGEANVKITESDLANFKPVAVLYDLMNVGRAGRDPTGTGDVSARIAGGTLTLVDATYFNRGVFANAFGDVQGVGDLDTAALNLTLVGTLQPLKQSGSGFIEQIFGTANDTLAALQGAATAVRATGTLKQPKVEQVGLSELGSDIQSVLIGKSK